jgi:hypothetical protein
LAIDHNQIWQDSIATLSQLIRQRRKLDKAIARLEQMIRWGPLSGSAKPQQPSNPKSGRIGFTDAVRLVFSTYRIWLSPVLVRDLLPSIGFKTDPYKHPLPTIHVILKRLVSRGELIQCKQSSGVTVFFWASAVEEIKSQLASQKSLNRLTNKSRTASVDLVT